MFQQEWMVTPNKQTYTIWNKIWKEKNSRSFKEET